MSYLNFNNFIIIAIVIILLILIFVVRCCAVCSESTTVKTVNRRRRQPQYIYEDASGGVARPSGFSESPTPTVPHSSASARYALRTVDNGSGMDDFVVISGSDKSLSSPVVVPPYPVEARHPTPQIVPPGPGFATAHPPYPTHTPHPVPETTYPPTVGAAPYPPTAGIAPYPPTAGAAPYPPTAGAAPYPPVSSGAPYPPVSPPVGGSAPYPDFGAQPPSYSEAVSQPPVQPLPVKDGYSKQAPYNPNY